MPIFSRYDGPPLLEQIASVSNLTVAWRRVKANIPTQRRGRSSGTDAMTLHDFDADWQRQMAQLADELRGGTYRPLPPRQISMPKRSGGTRAIAILAVRDRIVQRAAQQVLEPVFDPLLLDCSYGCRPRVGVPQAVERVARYAEQGLTWVVDADIAAYFDGIDQRILLSLVRQRVNEAPLLHLVGQLLASNAAVAAENAPLPGERQSLGLLRRGGDALRHALAGWPPSFGADAPVLAPDYMAADWEQPGGGWTRPGVPSIDQSPINALWTAYMLGKPALGVARKLLPYAQRLGMRRIATAGAAAVGVAAAWELWASWHAQHGNGALQGGALSPLLANIYLHPFDLALSSQGLRLVRFMDDFVVMCASQGEAERALRLVEQQLLTLRLRLNADKSRIVRYDDGLEFLGQALAPKRRRVVPQWVSFDEAEQALKAGAGKVKRQFKRKK